MLDFSSLSPHLHVRVSPKAKRLALRLDTRMRCVHLIIPKRASLRKAYEFAEQHRTWIDDKIKTLPAPLALVEGTIIPVMGRERRLVVIRTSHKRTTITLNDDAVIVTTALDDYTPRLMRFIKEYAGAEMRRIADEKAARINKKITVFRVRDMKTRWGSCSTDGKMTLSWRLAFAPHAAIDYVIAHEAAHLIHPHHGESFWALCEKLSMSFKEGHGWMKTHGHSLSQWGI